jgi:RES domain.
VTSYPTQKVDWKSWRIIPSRNPPVDLYRRVAPPEDWRSVINIEVLTNPRLREMKEGLGLVRPEDLKGGVTQNWILAPFTYLNPEGGRFSDGTFGSCFLAKDLSTALLESIRLRERFLSVTGQGPISLDMRVIITDVCGEFEIDLPSDKFSDERARKEYWKERRQSGCNGVYFRAVDLHSDECVEAFRPCVMLKATQERHLTYAWDGQKIAKIYDFRIGENVDLDALRMRGELKYVGSDPVGRIYAAK